MTPALAVGLFSFIRTIDWKSHTPSNIGLHCMYRGQRERKTLDLEDNQFEWRSTILHIPACIRADSSHGRDMPLFVRTKKSNMVHVVHRRQARGTRLFEFPRA